MSDPIASVDDEIVTLGEVRERFARTVGLTLCGSGGDTRREVQQVVQDLIDDLLIVRSFRAGNRRDLTTAEIDFEILQRLSHRGGGREPDLFAYLEYSGQTELQFRTQVEKDLIVRRLRSEHRLLASPVTPADVEAYFSEHAESLRREDAVHLRLIRLSTVEGANDETLDQRATRVMERLRSGEAFADVARDVSDDSRRIRGGDWGWVAPADLREELASAIKQLEVGTFSEPIALERDRFVLRVEAKRTAGIPPFAELRDEIRSLLSLQAGDKAERRWLEELRSRARIRILDPTLW